MRDSPAEAASPFLVPTDTVLLRANHFAPRRRLGLTLPQLRKGPLALLLTLAAALAVGQKYQLPAWATTVLAVVAGVLVVACAPSWRTARPREGPTTRADASRLEFLVIAEALLANERAGLLVLTEAADGLHADLLEARMPWPADAIEATLLRRRSMPVSRLVADWRGGTGNAMATLEELAVRRGVFQEVTTRRGSALVPTPRTDAALAKGLPAPLVETCPTDRPALWRSLTAAIEEGFLLSPTPARDPQSAADPRADAGVDRFGIPSGTMPNDALTTAAIVAAMLIIGAIAVVRLMAPGWASSPALGWWGWPPLFAAGAAVALFFAARRTWPDEPLPAQGSPGEEEALAARRRRRLSRPRVRPPLLLRLLASVVMAMLVYLLTAWITPMGVAVVALAVGFVSWRSRQWYRVQLLMPSAREVELAVARRSREQSAAEARRNEEEAPGRTAARKRAEARTRRQHWLAAGDLPLPTAAALARTDRRRHLARAAIRQHLMALGLFVSGLTVVASAMALAGRTAPELIVFCVLAWLFCLRGLPGRLLQAVHATRSESWKIGRGPAALLVRALSAALPDAGTGRLAEAGRTLRRRMAEEPDFWRDEALDLAAPLGRAPRILAIVTAVLGLPLLASGLIGGNGANGIAGAALLGLAAAYGWFLRSPAAASAASAQLGVRLVLLRVFGSPSFDDLLELVRPWLLCGPVAHLEGYDSVARSAEVREALALDRIDAVLVHSPEDLAQCLAALTPDADDNGRYRRQAFQCTDAIWRTAIRALFDRTDAVLMDLSDLGPQDMGCAYELGLLLDRVPLSQVLLLIDDATTNHDCLQQVLDEAEQRIAADSPNLDNPAAAWRLLRIGGASVRKPDESYHAWLRRQDQRLAPLALVQFLLSGLAADKNRGGSSRAPVGQGEKVPGAFGEAAGQPAEQVAKR